jgi:hypothetical protein
MGFRKSRTRRWGIEVSVEGDALVPVFRVFEMDSPGALSTLCLSEHPTLVEAKAAHRDLVSWEDLVDEAEAVQQVSTPTESTFEGGSGYLIYDKRLTVSREGPGDNDPSPHLLDARRVSYTCPENVGTFRPRRELTV